MSDLIEKTIQTIPSYEVAKMMEVEHPKVLRMIEGDKTHIGIIPTLDKAQMGSISYFIKSTYKDSMNREKPYYECTKLGCDMLANKMTGEKGILFTAKYVKRFEEMEQYIKEQQLQLTEKERLQLQILNGSDMERVGALKQYENIISKPLIETIEKQSDTITELVPHANYAEKVLEDNKTLLTITQIAKDFGMSGHALNDLLHTLGVQYKQGGQWLLYSKYQGKGYARTVQSDVPNAKPQTKWTQAGKKFIHEILGKNGYKTTWIRQQEAAQVQQTFKFDDFDN